MCAHAVSVGIEKLEGVETVRVSLEEGLAEVTLKPGNALDPEQIREVARDGGFTPKGAEVRARGLLVVEGETLALAVTGLEREYRLVAPSGAEDRLAVLAAAAPGTSVVVTGGLPEGAGHEAGAEGVLELRDFEVEAP